MRRVVILLLMMSVITTCAQELKVVNKKDGKGVENVVIYNLDESTTAMTNYLGITNVEHFNTNDTLIFQHPSFSPLLIPYFELNKLEYLVVMTERYINLSEIVISASKWEQNRNEIPNKITKIDKKNIEIYNPQTSADFLASSNEVFIQKSQMGGGSPMIRGFAANSVLLVLDGVRMNNAIYRSGNLQNVITIDPNIIENAEVIFGPGSIIYGSDALGGIMEAASRGAFNAGGMVLGILPGEDKNDANQYVTIKVASGLGIGRNILIARTADALIAVGGAYGTLSEIAFALQLGKPVAGIETWDIEGVMPARDAANAMELISGRLS